MKKILLIICAVLIGMTGFAQQKAMISHSLKNYAVKIQPAIKETENLNSATLLPSVKKDLPPEEVAIGITYYDLQSNSSSENRIYKYADGTIGATWTMGMTTPNFADRGTGYNYFDGTTWGPEPTARIELQRTGWPSYTKWGTNGEIVAAHHDTQGLVISKREQKGTDTWSGSIFAGPTGAVDISWPRIVTAGTDNKTLHILASTYSAYQGLDLALLYSRSQDGGTTWDIQHQIIPGMSSTEYYGFEGDTYTWAEPRNNILAFIVGCKQTDMFIMKSTDGGTTWTKTVIWEHPIPFWNGTAATADTFYCPDGTHSIVIDNNGTIHVAFGINRAHADDAGSYWFPGVGGIGYWKEGDATWTGGNQWEALDPDLLDAEGKLIGYAIDVNGNGTWDILEDIASYYIGSSSFPQLVVDDQNRLILTYSSITETFDNGTQNYRRLWCRGSNDNGNTWSDNIYDLNSDIVHLYDECVFPSVATNSDDYFYLVYQADEEPGLAVRGDEDPYTENKIYFMKVLKDDIVSAFIPPMPTNLQFTQNYNNITLTWTAPATDALLGYDVYRNGTKINTTLVTPTTYEDSDLGYGIYSYCVKAVYEGGSSECSNTVQATVLIKPTNLNAVAEILNVNLTWDAPSRALLGYNIYRGGASTPVNASPVLFTNYTDVVPAIGTYIYTVKALYTEGESDASDPATALVTSINEPTSQGIKIYPNPVGKQMHVKSNIEMNRIVLLNLVGQVVYDGTIKSNTFNMNTFDLLSGVYMLKVYTNKGVTTSRVIVE